MTAPIRRRAGVGMPSAEMVERMNAAVRGFTTYPWAGVDWTLSYAAFLAYTLCIITFRFPVGTEAMSIALLTLPLERRPLRLPMLSVLTFALVGWSLIGVLTTQWPDLVLDALTEFAKVSAVVFVGLNVITSRARFRMFLAWTTVAFMLFPVKGTLFNYFLNSNTLQGRAIWGYIYSNPNDLAGLTLLQLSVVLAAIEVERHKLVQLALRVCIVPLVLVIFLTQSRGAFIATVAFVSFSGRQYLKQISFKGVLGLALVAMTVFFVAPESTWRRLSTIRTATDENAYTDPDEVVDAQTLSDQGSSQQRLAIWKVAEAVIADNAVTGVGFGAYPMAHFEMQQKAGMPATARGRRDTHSTYLKIMAEVGFVGFSIFMAIIVSTMRSAMTAAKRWKDKAPAFIRQVRTLQYGMYAYLVAGIWGSYGALVATYMQMVIIVAATLLLNDEGMRSEPAPLRKSAMRGPRRMPMAAASVRP